MENLHTFLWISNFFSVFPGAAGSFSLSFPVLQCSKSQSLLCAVPFTTPFLLFACYLSSHVQISHSQWYCYFVQWVLLLTRSFGLIWIGTCLFNPLGFKQIPQCAGKFLY